MEFVSLSLLPEDFAVKVLPLLEASVSVQLQVTGNSMRPLWRHRRDSVTLVRCDPAQLGQGDLPLVRHTTGQFVIHRVVAVYPDHLDLCGDGLIRLERHISKDQVVARVSAFCRKGRNFSLDLPLYRFYVNVWSFLRPVRPFLLRIIRFLDLD